MPSWVYSDWFFWALLVIIGLPVLTIVLTEVHARLVRRRSSMAKPVQMLRSYVLPLGALLVLLTQIPNDVVSNDGYWVKITATVFGLLVVMFTLSAINTALFINATEDSWRSRMPSIFVDIGRIILIGIGLAILLSWVWGADVGALFTALGVTSIVIGLALQNAIGSIISGLLLLFEQPFKLGDWLKTAAGTGRVIEVNWRAVHIDTGSGVAIVPNSSLASASFTNLSKPSLAFTESVETSFAEEEEPLQVIAVLNEVAAGIALVPPGNEPSSVRTGSGSYVTSIPLDTIADAGPARAQFQTRLWYAARRHNLALNGADISKGESTADVERLLTEVVRHLNIPAEQIPDLAKRMDIERYAVGEVIQPVGTIPTALRYITSGQVAIRIKVDNFGGEYTVLQLSVGDILGESALTRTPTIKSSVALTEVQVLLLPQDVVDDLLRTNFRLARELGQQVEQRRKLLEDAMARLAERRSSDAPSVVAEA